MLTEERLQDMRDRLRNGFTLLDKATHANDRDVAEMLLGHIAAQAREIESLKHDLSRLLSITSEQATEILGKDKALAEIRREYCVLSRACGNWREWPGQAQTDHDHPDWKAAARALIERDVQSLFLKKAETALERIAAGTQTGGHCAGIARAVLSELQKV